MIDQDKLFQQVLKLFSYRDRTEWEIRQYLFKKLKTKKQSSSTISTIVKRLYDFNLLNDDKFATEWIKIRTKSKFHGPKRLYLDLYKKGISKQLIKKNLRQYSPQFWIKIATHFLKKKLSRIKNQDINKQRQKAFQFLSYNGFNFDTIKSAIDALIPKG